MNKKKLDITSENFYRMVFENEGGGNQNDATFWSLSSEYFEAARVLYNTPPTRINYKHVIYYLLGHSAELSLKCYLFKNGLDKETLKKEFQHNLAKLLTEAEKNGLPMAQRSFESIYELSKTYNHKGFEYRENKKNSFPNQEKLVLETKKLLTIVRNSFREQDFMVSVSEKELAIYEDARNMANIAVYGVELQVNRLRRNENEITDFVMQPIIDFHFLITALSRLHQSAQLVSTIFDISSAINKFDSNLPDLRSIRNLLEHIDEYRLGKGHNKSVPKETYQTICFDNNLVKWASYEIDMELALQSSGELFMDIKNKSANNESTP